MQMIFHFYVKEVSYDYQDGAAERTERGLSG